MPKHTCAHTVPIFKHLKEETFEKINNLLVHENFEKGDIIFSPYKNKGLFIVSKGKIKEYQISQNAKEQLLRIHTHGAVLGEYTLFSEEFPHSYAEALNDVKICLLKKEDFKKLIMDEPSIALELLAEFNKKLEETEKQTVKIATETVSDRIVSYIYDLYLESEKLKVKIPMNMKELANYLGTTPETVSRRFKDLEKEGYIKRSGKNIEILDLEYFTLK